MSDIFVAASLASYYRTYRKLRSQLSASTRNALLLFGLTAVWYQLTTSFVTVSLSFVRIFFGYTVVLIIITLSQILFESRRTKIAVALASVFCIMLVGALINMNVFPDLRYYAFTTYIIIPLLMALWLHRMFPSPFTYGMITFVILIAPAYLFAVSGYILVVPHLIGAIALPSALISAIFASLNRPWRLIPTLFLIFIGTILAVPVIVASLVSGDVGITLFTLFAYGLAMSVILPFEYFVDEALSTRARTPFYMAVTLFSVGLLVETHWVNWAFSYTTSNAVGLDLAQLLFIEIHGVWDSNIVYFDWILGIVAVSSFLMAALSTTYSEKVTDYAVDFIIIVGVPLAIFGSPYINDGRYDLGVLYIFLLMYILFAVAIYARLAYALVRQGQGSAATRFTMFTLGSLTAGIVSMYSDRMLFILDPIFQTIAILLLLFSTPGNPVHRIARLLRGLEDKQEGT